MFARYAFPPNHYGYRGPDDADGGSSQPAGDDHELRTVLRKRKDRVVTTTTFGGTRVVDMPLGEQLPRIC